MSRFTTPIDDVALKPSASTGTPCNNALTGTLSVLGGLGALALVGPGIGIVGSFGAIGIGAVEIFTGGAVLSGAVAHSAQKSSRAKKPKASARPKTTTPVDPIESEIDNLRRGDF